MNNRHRIPLVKTLWGDLRFAEGVDDEYAYRDLEGLRYAYSEVELLLGDLKEILAKEASGKWELWQHPEAISVAEFRNKKVVRKPESLIAKIWNQCLGPTAIPFEPAKRQELIDKGRQHAELRRHIEAWEEMKRTGSKWANYLVD